MKRIKSINQTILFLVVFQSAMLTHAQLPDPEQGLRADWMRGTWGLNWKPGVGANVMKTTKVEDFLDQIKDLKTVDYIQLHINGSGIQTPIHAAPLPVLEALHSTEWDPLLENAMVVPPASDGDNFLIWLKAIKAAGYRTQVYLNGANMMKRHVKKAPCTHVPQYDHPASIPTISEVWKRHCDSNFQDFIESRVTHTEQYDESAVVQEGDTTGHPDRKYAFCYAEYVIKAYSERYGMLIDAWLFDGARNIEGQTGDEPLLHPGDPTHLEAYKAFADAARAGNPDAVVCFNNGLGAADAVNNPYHAIIYDDYTMGHPFNGGKFIGDDSGGFPSNYDQNFHLCTWISDHDGYVFSDGPSWAQNIIGHWDPPMSTSSWKAGDTPALSDEDFNLWNLTTLQGYGAVSWGVAINHNPPLANDWAIAQLRQGDAYLSVHQLPGAPNWARQATILPPAYSGQAYYHTLVEGIDFWDPEGDAITNLFLLAGDPFPSWLTITESDMDGTYILGGIPTETDSAVYSFHIRIEDASGGTNREVELKVLANPYEFTDPGDGSPVWYADSLQPVRAKALDSFNIVLVQGRDFYDFEGDGLTISEVEGAEWLNLDEVSQGIWEISGIPPESAEGTHFFSLSLSDGVRSALAVVQLIVDPLDPVYSYMHLQIKAVPDTSYGINSVATMVSDIQTAPDSLATFQISVDVTPGEGKAITSGISGGLSTSRSWGLGGDGREDTKIALFFGDSADWVDIGNIQIIDFNANGGLLSLSDFRDIAFDSLTLVNAQSANKDAVALLENGIARDLGNLAGTPYAIAIESAREFSIGTGDSPVQLKNKWSVEGIGVKYDMGLFHLLSCMAENGSVLKTPDQKIYRQGSLITLIAIPDPDYQFEGWSGDTIGASISADTITLLMDADKRITASFSPITTIGKTDHPFNCTISPNPSNGIFRVHMDQLIKASYTVYSIKGAKLTEGKVNGSFDFDLSCFERGVYLLKLESEFGVDVKKIMLN